MTFLISPFQMYILHFGHFLKNRKNSGLTLGHNDDPVTQTWKMTQMAQFHVWFLHEEKDGVWQREANTAALRPG